MLSYLNAFENAVVFKGAYKCPGLLYFNDVLHLHTTCRSVRRVTLDHPRRLFGHSD